MKPSHTFIQTYLARLAVKLGVETLFAPQDTPLFVPLHTYLTTSVERPVKKL